jgi:hypothetical protein
MKVTTGSSVKSRASLKEIFFLLDFLRSSKKVIASATKIATQIIKSILNIIIFI